MCQFMSFFHNPINGDIAVSDVNSHGNTEKELSLNLNIWREGHYLPDGKVELRVTDKDRMTQKECEERFLTQYPTFVSFFNWTMAKKKKYDDSLDLRSLTSAKGLVLPKEIGGWLYLKDKVLKI